MSELTPIEGGCDGAGTFVSSFFSSSESLSSARLFLAIKSNLTDELKADPLLFLAFFFPPILPPSPRFGYSIWFSDCPSFIFGLSDGFSEAVLLQMSDVSRLTSKRFFCSLSRFDGACVVLKM